MIVSFDSIKGRGFLFDGISLKDVDNYSRD